MKRTGWVAALLLGCALAYPKAQFKRSIGGEFEYWYVEPKPPRMRDWHIPVYYGIRRKNGEWVALGPIAEGPFYKDGYCFWQLNVKHGDGDDQGTFWFAARDGEKGSRWFLRKYDEEMGFSLHWDPERELFVGLKRMRLGWKEFRDLYESAALRCRPVELDRGGKWLKRKVDVIEEP